MHIHSEEKEEYLLAVQRPKVMEKKLSSVCKPMNYYILLQNTQALCFKWAQSTEITKVSERLTFGVIKTIMTCVEGDKSDCQLLCLRFDNLTYHPQHRT